MKVGTRQLKNELSRYLREVRRGRSVFVTDRGRIVAEIRPVPLVAGRVEELLQELALRDELALPERPIEDFEPIRLVLEGSPLSKAVLEGRD